MKYKFYLKFLIVMMLLNSCHSSSQKKVEEPEYMPPLMFGKYEGPFHVTSKEIQVANGRGNGTPSVNLPSSGACFTLDCHSDFMVTKIEVRTEDDNSEYYLFYPKSVAEHKNASFDYQENDVYELKKLQQGIKCCIKRNKSPKPRWILLSLQIGCDFFPSIVIHQSGKE